MGGRYLFHTHRAATAWRLVLSEGAAAPDGYAPDDWTFTRARAAADTNPDVRTLCDRDGYCLFKIGAGFDELAADLAQASPPGRAAASCAPRRV